MTNGTLILNGATSGYVNLPADSCPAHRVTLEFWATFGANGNWRACLIRKYFRRQRLDYFYFSRTTAAAGNHGSADQYDDHLRRSRHARRSLRSRRVHFGPTNNYAAIYTNGVLEATLLSRWPGLFRQPRVSFIGRSLFTGDAYLTATIDELRLYDAGLRRRKLRRITNLTQPLALAVNLVQSNSVANVILSWPSWAVGFALQSSSNLIGWSTNGLTPRSPMTFGRCDSKN